MAVEPHKNDPPTPEILARRTAKEWRHEERELTSTHALWNLIIATHAAIVAATGLCVGNNKLPFATTLFLPMFSVSVGAMFGIIVLVFLLRRYDHISAVYFRIVSQETATNGLPPGFDKSKEEQKRQKAEIRYYYGRNVLEIIEMCLLIANLVMFYIVVMCHP
jgi:hypothetical protein